MELLDKEKTTELERSNIKIDELSQKIEALQFEVVSLQNALTDVDKDVNNDTGYADLVGAADAKSDDYYRRKIEQLPELEKLYEEKLEEIKMMTEMTEQLFEDKQKSDDRASELLYENDELREKLGAAESKMKEQVGRKQLDALPFSLLIHSPILRRQAWKRISANTKRSGRPLSATCKTLRRS